MIRVRTLLDTPFVSIQRVDHPPDDPHVDPDEESSEAYSINFVEAGSFTVEHERRVWTVDHQQLFVTTPGQRQTYRHGERDCAPADVCLVVSYKDADRDDIERARFNAIVSRAPVAPLTDRLAYLRRHLHRTLAGSGDALRLESLAAELLDGALIPGSARRVGPRQLEWYAERIDAARRTLDEDYTSDHTLSMLARDAGMSSYHFARVFRQLVGSPPHRYLVERRLSAADARLRDGASVTETCLAVGFRSLSHFIHAFRSRFGVPPGRTRRSIGESGTTSS